METQNVRVPDELVNAFNGMTQSVSLLYGVPNLLEAPDSVFDIGRPVPDAVRRYNTPNQARVAELADTLNGICELAAQSAQVSVQADCGEFLIQGFVLLRKFAKTINATDFIIGLDGEAIVERGAVRSDRKGELNALLDRVRVGEAALDWSALTQRQRYLAAALSLCALKGSDKVMEEINRSRDTSELILYLAQRLSVLEENIGELQFTASGSQLLAQIANFPVLQERMESLRRLKHIHVVQGTCKELFVPEEYIAPDPIAVRLAADVLGINPATNLLAVDENTKRTIFRDVLARFGSLDVAIATVLKLVTNEFCDDATVLSRTVNRPWQDGDTMQGFACILGATWRVESFCQSASPLKIKNGDLIPIPMPSNKAAPAIWQRTPEDIEDGLQDGDARRLAVLRERQACIRVEQKIKQDGIAFADLSAEDQALIETAAKRYQSRLWVYNQNSAGIKSPLNQISLIFNTAWDADGKINNQPHAISGIQSGIRIPFANVGNVRFWNESRRSEAHMGLKDVSTANAYTMIFHCLFQAAGIIV
ncbi:MAG: hypothetical protein KME26_01855 [Oscillatoria princeps RMCB-10]|jgi:hypothetical protein|nr:hypothetical protein [Oscillatoria princeps RMCB-10]